MSYQRERLYAVDRSTARRPTPLRTSNQLNGWISLFALIGAAVLIAMLFKG